MYSVLALKPRRLWP
ncbi:hemolysin transporter protein shlB, partial [Yersinia pestis PY-15]